MGQTLFDKIWARNLVTAESEDQPALLYVSLHLLHEITSPQAFAFLEGKAMPVRRPDLTVAMVDHCAPTARGADGAFLFKDRETQAQIGAMEAYCRKYRIPCLGLEHPRQGIVHAVAPELGLSRPGQVIVCGDSHTSTHGAFGAIAFGIGSSEVADVLATQCILQRKPRNLCVRVEGCLAPGVAAKDLALAIVRQLGALGGKGYAIEYQGPGVEALSMEERLTLCNMTIEAGSRFGLIAPDAVTWRYLRERPMPHVPLAGDDELVSDPDASWDRYETIDASRVAPMMSWGTNPAMAIERGQPIPEAGGDVEAQAMAYMGWRPGESTEGRRVDQVFIGSCTNGRLSDLREAARQLAGRSVAKHLACLVVPASRTIKAEAEAEGLHQVFQAAGATWGEPSCSLCNAMNGDVVAPGKLAVSTSNRNFEGRQGPGARTILVSPASAAQIAVRGYL